MIRSAERARERGQRPEHHCLRRGGSSAEVAAAQLEREGVSVEIIDLRSLSPYDWEAIARRSGRRIG